jgi:leader peptidase (prepilin peptidase)/N-methyltransferase
MSEWTFAALGVFVGLMAGCVVAAVSLRLPLSLRRAWRVDAHEFLELPFTPEMAVSAVPAHGFLKGWRFLIIEAVCATVGGVLCWRLGFSLEALVFGLLFWALIAVAVIDHESMYIPDVIVLPLLWAGLVFYALTAPDQLQWHVLGAAVGYCALRWLPVGQGDAKLCAVAGAWIGLEPLFTFAKIGAVIGVAVGIVYYCLRKKSEPYPFGPSLVVALIATASIQLMKF